jgi:two-component system cell cycle sensor histidine kinase/response regulator CckA
VLSPYFDGGPIVSSGGWIVKRVWIGALCALFLAVMAGAVLYYRASQAQARDGKYMEIAAVGRLKAAQMRQWRSERLSDVTVAAGSPFLGGAAEAWLEDPAAHPRVQADLVAWLTLTMTVDQYSQALLLDAHGRVLLATPGASTRTGQETLAALSSAAQSSAPPAGRAALSDLYRDDAGNLFCDAVAPVTLRNGVPVAFIDLRIDARKYLFPLVESWPTRTRSAQIILVRKQGDGALFLTGLPSGNHGAMSVLVPLSRTDVPEVQAVDGRQGRFEGRDYRGVRVLAELQAISGTPWFLVSEVDAAEASREADRRVFITFLIAALLVLLAGAGVGLALRQRQAKLYLSLLEAERNERETEQEYRTALYSIGDAVIGTDTHGSVWHMNPEAERLTGWKEAEARGKPIEKVFQIVNEQTRQPVRCPVVRVLHEGTVVGLANHTLLIARDGTERPIADSGAPIRGEDGALRGVILVFRDQSEERAARRRLEASEERYRSLVENLSVGIAGSDPFEVFTFANPAAEEIFAVPSGTLGGRSLREFLDDSEYARVLDQTARRRKGEKSTYDLTIRRPDGKKRHLQINAIPQASADGEFTGTFGTMQDVTEKRAAEESLRESEEHYRNTFMNAPFGVFHSTPDGRLLNANFAYARMMGYDSPQDIMETVNRKGMAEALYQDPSQRSAVITELLQKGGWQVFPVTYRTRDGKIISAMLTIRRYSRHAASGIELEGFVEDITERERAEEERKKLQEQLLQAQKMEAVGRLAGGIAHDFNNILTAIYGYCEMGMEHTLKGEQALHSFFLQIRDSASRAANLTSQLLAFSRRRILQPRQVNLGELVGAMMDMLKRLLGEDIDVHSHCATDVWSVRADSGQIEQVIMNLAVNSRDAMPGGGVLTIETSNVRLEEGYPRPHGEIEAGDYVVLAVSDTGHGMDAATMERIYEPFFTTKEAGKGTGLGLATVYGIVRQSGGNIYCYSEPGKGTTFKIYLPRSEGDSEEAARAEPGAVAPARRNATILFVDDDEAVRTIAVTILRSAGYTVVAARDGKEALALLASLGSPLDVLITDVVMPGMNGIEVARFVTQRFTKARVLYVSGYTEDAAVHQGIFQGGVELLQKPFTATNLLQRVRDMLEK